ncbi:DUF1565 domain-containing protein [Streptomyces sp. MP131-18]|uniref:right-handed parallel beta-helix repeat-containing protein n=1 Tax=Streptomyces sp. MP131-18 TaxID=1857892 RepID=UPI00209AF0E8|nr:DUF1565 domain-containing protein [Streptomyces sp. MP131-18]
MTASLAVVFGALVASPTGTASAQAAELYVAPGGDDSNPGSLDEPLQTIQAAVDLAGAGTTIHLREGTYAPDTNIQLLHSGTESQPITLRSYAGEHAVLDGENMPYTPGEVGSTIPRPDRGAIHLEGDYWHIIGLEIINGPYGIFGMDTSHNVFKDLVTRDNYETGLHLVGDVGVVSDNQVINLDSYGNRDPRKNGESADGLAIKQGEGEGNIVRGVRLWNNADDGYDAFDFRAPILVEDSMAWGNGFNRWDLPGYQGDGNGFKLGGGDPDPAVDHITRNSIAFGNAVDGFDDNGNPGAMEIENCTAWDNPGNGFDFSDGESTLTDNLAVDNGNAVDLGSNGAGGSGNSWDTGEEWEVESTDPTTITGPRNPDGSIPSSDFLVPSNGADVGARF